VGSIPSAGALPGGIVYATDELVRRASDDELAFFLGHELAHVALRHHVDRARMTRALAVAQGMVKKGGAEALGVFSHDQELEADRYGALYAVRAGFALSACHRALEHLEAWLPGTRNHGHPAFGERRASLVGFEDELRAALASFDRAYRALHDRDADTAVADLTLFVAEFPGSASGRLNLGLAYFTRVRLRAGTPSGLAEPFVALPDPGVLLRGVLDQSELSMAQSHLEEAARLAPERAEAHAALALVLLRGGSLDRAEAALAAAERLAPDMPELALYRGNLAYARERWPQAVRAYEGALALRHDWPEARHNLARALEQAGDSARATLIWNQLVSNEGFREAAALRLARLEREHN
jgi:predicted Zn-dependent protease